MRRPGRPARVVRTVAQVNGTGRSSMEIGVRIETQPWNDPSETSLHRKSEIDRGRAAG